MSRETHVQFCEGLGVPFPGATHLVQFFGNLPDSNESAASAVCSESMNNALSMRSIQRIGDLYAEVQDRIDRQGMPVNALAEAFASRYCIAK